MRGAKKGGSSRSCSCEQRARAPHHSSKLTGQLLLEHEQKHVVMCEVNHL